MPVFGDFVHEKVMPKDLSVYKRMPIVNSLCQLCHLYSSHRFTSQLKLKIKIEHAAKNCQPADHHSMNDFRDS